MTYGMRNSGERVRNLSHTITHEVITYKCNFSHTYPIFPIDIDCHRCNFYV